MQQTGGWAAGPCRAIGQGSQRAAPGGVAAPARKRLPRRDRPLSPTLHAQRPPHPPRLPSLPPQVKSTFPVKLFATNMVVLVPVPDQTARASFNITAGDRPAVTVCARFTPC